MRIRARQEDGVALIVALMVTFVVLLLSTVVISQAIHGTDQSAYNRQRLTSVNAAEAGLDNYFNYLEVTPVLELSTAAPLPERLGSSGGTIEFALTPTFYDDEVGEDPFSGTPSASNYPKSVLLVSVGTTNDGTERTMESFVLLEPIYGGLTGAVVTNSTTTFSNNFTINGNNGNDADVYVLNGNFTVPSGLQTIHGDIWVHGGTAVIGTGLHVYGEVWANGSVTVNHPSALVDLAAKSTTSSLTVTTGNVTGDAYYCTGSAPGANVHGQKIQTCALGAPPTTVFPQIPYTPSAWTDQGYYINPTYTGTSACDEREELHRGHRGRDLQRGGGRSVRDTRARSSTSTPRARSRRRTTRRSRWARTSPSSRRAPSTSASGRPGTASTRRRISTS